MPEKFDGFFARVQALRVPDGLETPEITVFGLARGDIERPDPVRFIPQLREDSL